MPLLPHFTRPLTDNDRRGWKPQKIMAQWYTDSPVLKTISLETRNGVEGVLSRYTMLQDSVRVAVFYAANKLGSIKVAYELEADPALPDIPKIGMQMGINKNFTDLSWFGKGPMENYIDKSYGADVGWYRMNLSAFIENYVVPQENGNRTDVRFFQLMDQRGQEGMAVTTDSLLSISVWPYTEKISSRRNTQRICILPDLIR